jgi:hypothetical protein
MRLWPTSVALLLGVLALGACGDDDKPAKGAATAAVPCRPGEKQVTEEDPDFKKLGVRLVGEAVVLACLDNPRAGGQERLVGYRLGRPKGQSGSDFCVITTGDAEPVLAGPSCDAVDKLPDDNVVGGGGDVDVKSNGTLEDADGKVLRQSSEGTVSGRVRAVKVHYKTSMGTARTADAQLVRVTSQDVLRRLDLPEPFGWYMVSVDGTEITDLEPVGAGGESLGKRSFRDLIDRLSKG